MTAEALKRKLQEIVASDTEVLNVTYYQAKKSNLIVVVTKVNYRTLPPRLYSRGYETIEEALKDLSEVNIYIPLDME